MTDRVRRAPLPVIATIAALAVGLVGGWVAHGILTPTSSLDVFDTAVSMDAPPAMEQFWTEGYGEWRPIGENSGVTIWGGQGFEPPAESTGDELVNRPDSKWVARVCIAWIEISEEFRIRCVARSEFLSNGVQLAGYRWGPTGGVAVDSSERR